MIVHFEWDRCYDECLNVFNWSWLFLGMQVQDLADQGDLFVGFLPQPGGGPYFLGHWEPEELSSLHSSPCSVHHSSRPPTLSPVSERSQQDRDNGDHRNQNHTNFNPDFENQSQHDENFMNHSLQIQSTESSQCWNNQNPFTENHQCPEYQYLNVECECTQAEDLKNRVSSHEFILSSCAPEPHQTQSTRMQPVPPSCDLAEKHKREHREQVKSQDKPSKCTATTQMLNRKCSL